MSDDTPITADSPLGRALAADKAPDLPVGFADRVLTATKDRPSPLPETRAGGGGVTRWRSARRLAVGAVIAGALATTAAATGLLGDLPISIPSAEKVWATITGQDESSEPAVPTKTNGPAELLPEASAPPILEGPIDSPEELEEAFRRVDEVRGNRTNNRRDRVDQRIDNIIERRREQGLPAPTPEQEERLRERLDQSRERRDLRREDRLEQRREELRERVEAGEDLTREDFVREQREAVGQPGRRGRMERLRDLSPEERRERIRQFREQRQQRLERRLQQETELGPPADPTQAPTDAVDPAGPAAPQNEDDQEI